MYKTQFINSLPDQQLSRQRWLELADEFVKAESDDVLEAALNLLPPEVSVIRKKELLAKLKSRRDHIPAAIDADLRLTAKEEHIKVTETPGRGLMVTVSKPGSGNAAGEQLWQIQYDAEVTRELRLYTSGGADHISIDLPTSAIKLRLIDSTGENNVQVLSSARPIDLYSPGLQGGLSDYQKKLRTHISADTANRRFQPTNMYNIWMPLLTGAINADDGFLLGSGFKYIGKDGFRKSPYSTMQSLLVTHSFSTNAFRIQYNGEWAQAIGKADLVLKADYQGPGNRTNFFGRGNNTQLDKSGDYHKFYRARYDLYNLTSSLRWRTGHNASILAGTALQYYNYEQNDNEDRFISTALAQRYAYDAQTLAEPKAHLGLGLSFTSDQRDNYILPSRGYFFNVELAGYEGLNGHSRSYAQLRQEFIFYQSLNASGTAVVFNRTGGGFTMGKPAFYQSLYLGGQGNLLGYLKYRYAGQQMFFNNLQARIKLFDIASYILPGQLGISAFYDTGRVWVKGENSEKWHHGEGGGLYFVPAGLTAIQVLAGHSEEGWYPYISFNFRL